MSVSDGTRLIGRERELAALGQELEATFAGAGRLVVVLGEPGIGKTRIASALAAAARERGADVAWGRCHEGEGAPIYWPFAQALGSAGLSALAAELRAGESGADAEPARARFELFERVRTALAALTQSRPLVLVIDDLHWADVGSLRLLEFLARELESTRVLLIATARPDEPRADPERLRALVALRRLGRTQALAGLETPDVRALLRDHLQREPEESAVAQVVSVTEGNPYFVIEMALLMGTARGGIPSGVRELMRRRIEPVPPDSLRALELAAVLGREFELDPLAASLAQTPAQVVAALAPALELGLVRPVPGALRRWGFAHALLREALYAGLDPERRIALHASIASALEGLASADESERVAALAHHYFEAAQVAAPGKAIHYALQAGRRALALYDFEQAARQFERALAGSSLVKDAGAELEAELGLGEALHGLGDRKRMNAAFRTALVAARREGAQSFANAVLRFARARAELGAVDFELNSLLEEALDSLPAEEPALRARLLAQLAAGLHLVAGSEDRARRLVEEASELAHELDDPAVLAFVLRRRLIALLGPDDLKARRAAAEELLAMSALRPSARLDALSAEIDAHAELGDRAALDRRLAEFHQQVGGSREPFLLWLGETYRSSSALLEGRFADAEAHARDGLALGLRVHARSPSLRFAAQLLLLRAFQGRLSEVGPLLDGGASETSAVPAWRAVRANFLAILGRNAEARSEFEALAANDFAQFPRGTAWLNAHYLLAMTCWHLRDASRAEILYPLLAPYAGRIAVASPLVVLLGPIDECLGALASVLGRTDAAEAHFTAALALAERMRALPWQAQIRAEWAGALAARGGAGDRERARALLGEAEALAGTMGLALRLGGIAAVSEPPSAPPRTAVLRREGDVWAIEFEGRTSRVRDIVGIRHLVRLLAQPGRETGSFELASRADAGLDRGDAGEQLDARALAEYRERLRELEAELDGAERDADRGRAERLAAERELLRAELARAFGLGDRPRRAGSADERTRVAVTRAIRYAIERIAACDEALAEHLRRSVRTGAFCAYEPSSRDPLTWSLSETPS